MHWKIVIIHGRKERVYVDEWRGKGTPVRLGRCRVCACVSETCRLTVPNEIQRQTKVLLMGVNLDFVLVITWP